MNLESTSTGTRTRLLLLFYISQRGCHFVVLIPQYQCLREYHPTTHTCMWVSRVLLSQCLMPVCAYTIVKYICCGCVPAQARRRVHTAFCILTFQNPGNSTSFIFQFLLESPFHDPISPAEPPSGQINKWHR